MIRKLIFKKQICTGWCVHTAEREKRLNVEAFAASDKRGGAWVLSGRKHLISFSSGKAFCDNPKEGSGEKQFLPSVITSSPYKSSISLTGGGFSPPPCTPVQQKPFSVPAAGRYVSNSSATRKAHKLLYGQGKGEMTTADWRSAFKNEKKNKKTRRLLSLPSKSWGSV